MADRRQLTADRAFVYAVDMCGRFALKTPDVTLAAQFGATLLESFEPRYNIPPGGPISVVRVEKGKRILKQDHWGLLPFWAKDRSFAAKTFNARAETVAEKPSFKKAFLARRCLIPVDGYFEWQKPGPSAPETRAPDDKGSGKVPFYFTLQTGEAFALAGLWETWKDPATGKSVESCTILTTSANELVAPVHDRMPVILDLEAQARWLDPANQYPTDLQSLLKPFDPKLMALRKVSPKVNSPQNTGVDILD